VTQEKSYVNNINFLGLGSQRCASTWLHAVLSKYSHVYLPRKEFNFWSGFVNQESLKDYLSEFENPPKQSYLIGEISPSYAAMYEEEVALLKEILPELRIILIIRNPVDRLISSITRGWTYHHVDKGASTSRNLFHLLKTVDSGLNIRLTDYQRTYKVWVEHFGQENVFIEKFDNIVANPELTLSKILNFLDIEPSSLNQTLDLSKKPNRSKEEIKQEIPEFLKWYIALTWLSRVKIMNQALPLELTEWVKNLEAIYHANKFNLRFWLIYLIYRLYFYIPYHFFYATFKYFQIKYKVFRSRTELKL
jgi:hypothetical protein